MGSNVTLPALIASFELKDIETTRRIGTIAISVTRMKNVVQIN
jgi:hypothetical protein